MPKLWLPIAALLGLGVLASAQTVEKDIPYGPGPSQKLDLHLPKSGKGFATVIFVHGGSLATGDKNDDDYRNVGLPFPDAGIACASVNYRLLDTSRWPAPAEDVASAVSWVVKNIPSRGGNPREIYLFGHSSGAMLVALVGSDEKYLKSAGLTLADIRGVVPAGSIMWDKVIEEAIATNGRDRVKERFRVHPDYRAYDSLEQYEEMWAFRHIHAGLPRFLFLIAEAEQVNPPVLETDSAFVDAARKLGNEAEYRVLAGETHYSLIRGLNGKSSAAFEIIVRFVKGRPSSRP